MSAPVYYGGAHADGDEDPLRPPPILFQGRQWSSEELAARAVAARDFAQATLPPRPRMIAVAMPNHPEAVALFLGLSMLPVPLVVLSTDPREWRTSPPIPAGTPVFLLPRLAALAAEAEHLGLLPTIVPESGGGAGTTDLPLLTCPGLVMFTSGSEGRPKPVYRSLSKLLVAVWRRLWILGFPKGGGIISCLPLCRGHGLNNSVFGMTAMGGHIALLERFDHRAVLNLFASERYDHWTGTAVMTDILVRSELPQPVRAPAVCSSLRVPARVWRAFRERFGVPLRSSYSSTESGPVTLDAASPSEVRPETDGRPMPGTAVCIGDDPTSPFCPGQVGPIWVKTPWHMEGYGYPPELEPIQERDGWRPTHDIGRVDEAGYLYFLGRMGDSVKTSAGYLVNMAEVASTLAGHPAVIAAEVVAIDGGAGPVLGAILETAGNPSAEEIRDHAARHLPTWSRPRVIRFIDRLPRLPGGKVDRLACRALLQ
jgi:long-chain acyl-CoA synthetase